MPYSKEEAERITGFSNGVADRHGLPRYYKLVRSNGRATNADFTWPLPGEDSPGEWVSVKGRLIECRNGIHAARLSDIHRWYYSHIFRLYEIEIDEKSMKYYPNKVVSRKGRLVRRVEFDRKWKWWSVTSIAFMDRLNTAPSLMVQAAGAAVQLLVGPRRYNVDGMIEQLVAEQLAA